MRQALYRVSWPAKLSRVEISKVGLVGFFTQGLIFFFFLSSGIGGFSELHMDFLPYKYNASYGN